MLHWEDHLMNRYVAPFAFLPWHLAQGQHVLWRTLAFALGWVWVIPMVMMVLLPCFLLVVLPVDLWRELAKPR